MTWLIFTCSAGAIVLAGAKLSHYGDRIADLTGLGRVWIGVVLMAAATSLPELLTTISAGALQAPDLAAGNLFGAGLANMLTLGVIDLLHRQKRVWQHAALEQCLVAGLAMILTSLAAFFVLFRSEISHAGIGLGSLALLLLYVLGMRLVFRQEDVKRRAREQAALAKAESETDSLLARVGRRDALKAAGTGFGAATLVLLIAAPFLASSANDLAEQTGISASFIGTSLVAIVTTLPELVASLTAVRLGAFDLAVGNLFGSNAFNMAAFAFADLAYREGPILSMIAPSHALTAAWSIVLMNVGLMGIIYRVEKRYWLIEPDSLLMMFGYLLGLWLLFG